jgi:preprotein translocase subunit SecA
MIAGQVLNAGAIAEASTGEGKTIACYPAVYMMALQGKKVHVVTTNDYLVKRDRDFAAPVFALLGMTVGAIQQPMDNVQRKPEYDCNVIYGMNSEFGFDYLRDNMRLSVAEQVQGPQDFAIVDEVDNILIDEARTPLIISGPAMGNVERYRKADAVLREIIKRHFPYAQAEKRAAAVKRTVKALQGDLSKAEGAKKPAIDKKLDQAVEELARAEEEMNGLTKYYEVEMDKKTAHFTHEGVSAAQDVAGIGSFYVGANMEWPHLLEQSLRAHVVYQRDHDYVVIDGGVVIVDEFTGRLMEGRQWSDGLHQSVEAKEHVTIKEENQTIATITIQNLFKLYGKLAGMTGTAMTEAEEFMKIYKLDIVTVPTHRPVNRVEHQDRIYGTVEEKFDALVEEINEYSKMGRPVLVGTTSIEKSELLSNMLTRTYGTIHEVLNARPDSVARESEIVALAGQQHPVKHGSKEMVGNVTIATNMAGRGTDIKLGPGVVWKNCKVPEATELARLGVTVQGEFPPGSTKCCIRCPEYDARTNCAHCYKPKVDADFPKRGRGQCRDVVPCGLHIVGTERHEARRIDNQLRGRSGRQGDPGSSRFFLSLRDDLLAIFGGEWTLKILTKVGYEQGQAIEFGMVSKAIANIQKKVEQRNFDMRKHLLEYDEVMDQQRRVFYGRRQQILEYKGVPEMIVEMVRQTILDAARDYLAPEYVRLCIAEWVRQALEVNIRPDRIRGDTLEEQAYIEDGIREVAKEEAVTNIGITIGEYADPDVEAREWDLAGMSAWAKTRYKVNISQNKLRDMNPEEMEQAIAAEALVNIEAVDLSPIQRYLEPGYPAKALAEWARNKFGVELAPAELMAEDGLHAGEKIQQAVEERYRRREIEYPVEYALDMTVGQSGTDNAYALKALCDWANRKYDAHLAPENVAGKKPAEVFAELVAISEKFLGGGLEQAIDGFLATLPGGSAAPPADLAPVIQWCKDRFDTAVTADELRQEGLRAKLLEVGQAFVRRELTELERFVLLQIYDSSWKDHLLAMDHLKSGVGLRGFAEQDPKIAYKKEGFRQFQDMLAGVREKVTDIVFKARLTSDSQMQSVYQVSRLVHEQLTGYDHLAQDMAAQQAAAAPQKVQTIIRQTPRVGRNDPCPCGSGKKFKKCCGKGL